MSSVKTNIVANIAGRLWGFVSIFAFYPLYLKFLGSESFGLVGFYSMLVGMLVVADVGLTSSINREFARLSVSDKSSGNMKNVLRTYEITYFFISVFIVISFFFLAPIISAQWLNFSNLQLEAVTDAIRLMGFAVSIQLLSGLYIGSPPLEGPHQWFKIDQAEWPSNAHSH